MRQNQGIELLRIVGAAAVVWFHSGAVGHEYFYFGLSLFIILSVQFEVGHNWGRSKSFRHRVWRLLWPWLIWFSLFGLISLLRGRPPIFLENGIIAGILWGSQGHLWYLPFIFTVLCGVDALKLAASRAQIFYSSVFLLLLILTAVPIWRPWSLQIGVPFAQYMQASSAVLLGAIIGIYKYIKYGDLGLYIVFFGLVCVGLASYDGVAWPHLIAALLILAALKFGSKILLPICILPISNCMFGVYLIQYLCLSATKIVVSFNEALWPICAFVLGTFVVMIFKRIIGAFSGHSGS